MTEKNKAKLEKLVETLYEAALTFEASEDTEHLKHILLVSNAMNEIVAKSLTENSHLRVRFNTFFGEIEKHIVKLKDEELLKDYFADNSQTLINLINETLNLVDDTFLGEQP
jgi:hypothetical protein